MKHWIFAAVIGLATCGQAWGWDDDEPILYGGRYRSMAEWRRAIDAEAQLESDRTDRYLNEQQMIFNQKRSLEIQEQQLRIEKRRLELEEGRALGGGSILGGNSILGEPAFFP